MTKKTRPAGNGTRGDDRFDLRIAQSEQFCNSSCGSFGYVEVVAHG